jgi:hypothetical protein
VVRRLQVPDQLFGELCGRFLPPPTDRGEQIIHPLIEWAARTRNQSVRSAEDESIGGKRQFGFRPARPLSPVGIDRRGASVPDKGSTTTLTTGDERRPVPGAGEAQSARRSRASTIVFRLRSD